MEAVFATLSQMEPADAMSVHPPAEPEARRFVLYRDVDPTGISGTGTVAEGIEFTDGAVALHWISGEHRSTVIWPDMAGVEAIHGHGGQTRIVWLDADESTVDIFRETYEPAGDPQ